MLAQGLSSPARSTRAARRVVARQPLDRVHGERREELHQRAGDPRGRRREPAGQLPRERDRRLARVDARRHVPAVRHGQRTEQGQVARVDLVLRTPKFREDQFRELFPSRTRRARRRTRRRRRPRRTRGTRGPARGGNDKAKAAANRGTRGKPPAKPVEIVFDDIRHRLGFLPVGVDVNDLEISPDGKTLLLSASSGASRISTRIRSTSWRASRPVARQLTSTAGAKSDAQFSPDGKEVYYLEDGRIQIDRRSSSARREPIAVTAEFDVDFASGAAHRVFTQAWTLLNDHFFDAEVQRRDWTGGARRFAPLRRRRRTSDELRRIINLMIGELNASHLGINPPPGRRRRPSTGRLGVRFDAASTRDRTADGSPSVIPLGPAAARAGIQRGDYHRRGRRQADRRGDESRRAAGAHDRQRRVVLTIAQRRGRRGRARASRCSRSIWRRRAGSSIAQWVEDAPRVCGEGRAAGGSATSTCRT